MGITPSNERGRWLLGRENPDTRRNRGWDDLAGVGIHHSHHFAAAPKEQTGLARIHGHAARRFAFRTRRFARRCFHRCSTVSLGASILRTRLSSSRLSKTEPLPSAAANSGPPLRSTVPTTFPVAASIAVALLLSPLKAKTLEVAESKIIASGFWPRHLDAVFESLQIENRNR